MDGKKRARATTEFRTNRAKLLADNPLCHYCANALATEADHVIESDRGGGNELSNLVASCKPCNARKGQAYRVQKERLKNGLVLTPKATTESGQELNDIQLIDLLKPLAHKEFLTKFRGQPLLNKIRCMRRGPILLKIIFFIFRSAGAQARTKL